MNYYEQLGVAPSADAEEIRRAHRRLTKIYHPDGHAEADAKQRAEAQMRRINAIVGVLSDPQSRLKYNEQLKAGTAPTDPTAARVLPPKPSRLHSWRWWIVSVAAAMALTVAVVWLWLNDWGGVFKSRHPTDITPEAADKVALPPDPLPASTTVTVVSPQQPEQGKSRTHPKETVNR